MKICKCDGCNNKSIGLGLCHKHYTRFRRYGDVDFPGFKGGGRPKKITFKINENNCFVTTSHKLNDDGYAEIRIRNRTTKIHRHIYEQCFGEIPKGLVVRHKCDNPSCINPEHLEIGTQQDNVNDKLLRNRQAKGSKIGASKLNENDVLLIKELLRSGLSNRSIAKKFKIHETVISNIKHNRIWKHVKEAN